MNKRDQVLAKLAMGLRLVDDAGFQRALALVPRLPGRSFDRVLLEGGLIDAAGHRRLVEAYRQLAPDSRSSARSSAPAPAARPSSPPPAARRSRPAPAPAPTPKQARHFDAAERGLFDSDVLLDSEGGGLLGAPPPPRVPPLHGDRPESFQTEKLRVRPDELDALATHKVRLPADGLGRGPRAPAGAEEDLDLAVPDDDDGEAGGDDVFAQPTVVLRDEPAQDPILMDDSGYSLLEDSGLELPDDDVFAQPTMVLHDEGAGDEDDLFAQPTMVLADSDAGSGDHSGDGPGGERAGEDVFAQPTMVLHDDAPLALADDPPAPSDEDDLFDQPTMVLADGDAPSGEMDVDLRLKRDVDTRGAPRQQVPGPRSRRGDGPLNRNEFERRIKMRLGFEGFSIGDYKVIGEIARGAFGVVLEVEPGGVTRSLAQDRGYAGRLALKVALENTSDPRETARFLEETRVQIQFDHPHIVRIFDSGVESGLTYYSMELIKGVETRSHVLKHGPMPALLAVRVAKEIASALAYVHTKRTYHRDLKPQNVLLDQTTQPYRAVLIDFGLVTEHLQNQDRGLILGTPSYMPPEQAQPRGNHGAINSTSDVYSLGATLFFLLTGKPPFSGKDPRKIIKQVIAERAPEAHELNPSVPKGISAICAKCLEKRQRDRYHSAKQLEADLDRELRSGRIKIKARSLLGKFLGKNK